MNIVHHKDCCINTASCFLSLANELWLLCFTCTLCCVFNEILIATWYCVEDICCCWCIEDPIEWYMLLVFWDAILKCVNLDYCNIHLKIEVVTTFYVKRDCWDCQYYWQHIFSVIVPFLKLEVEILTLYSPWQRL